MDEPEERSSHVKKTSNLGGIGIFITFSVCLLVFAGIVGFSKVLLSQLLVVMASISILFFLGVKDDLIGLSPLKKIVGQLAAAILVIVVSGIRIEGLEGLLGIESIPYFVSVLLTSLVFVFMVNAFNLIDGIDGLSGTLGMIASAIFGIFFLIEGRYLMALLSLTLIGSLAAFLRFNLSKTKKLFMGDSGSLFIGFILAYQAIVFMNMDLAVAQSVLLPNKIVIVLAILAYPILDTLRIFTVRVMHGKSPFAADRNHIHHRILSLGFSHRLATLTIALTQLNIIMTALLIGAFNIHIQLIILVSVVTIMGLLPCILKRKSGHIVWNSPRA